MSDDTTTIRPGLGDMASTTTTMIIRTKRIKSKGKRRLGLVGFIAPLTALAALTSFGFLVPNLHNLSAPPPGGAVALLNNTSETADASDTALAPEIDLAATISPATPTAADALATDARVKREEEERKAREEAEKQAQWDAEHQVDGSSAAHYGQGGDPSGAEVEVEDGQFILPLRGYTLGSPFGWRVHPIYRTQRFHTGIDLQKPCGSPVHASGDGVVTMSGWDGSLGNYVEINHGRLSTGYAHLSKINVKVGYEVSQGELIGYVGSTGTSTGCHVHWQAINNKGKFFDAMSLIH